MSAYFQHIETASAKLNLCLAVSYPPVDGFHQLTSVFQEIDLCDTLTFELANGWSITQGIADLKNARAKHGMTGLGSHITLDCGPLDIPLESNLIFKAVDAMEQAFGKAVAAADQVLHITVEKRIPAGGGLGGGSSDAAAAIRAYGALCEIDPLDAGALAVAAQLGSDVAFFLYGGAALMSGRGEILERRLPSFPLPIVLMGSNEGCNTGAVYRAFDAEPVPAPDAEMLADAIEDYAQAQTPIARAVASMFLAKSCANNLEPAACGALPILAERLKRAKADPNVLNALVTGSGATAYAICANEEAATAFAQTAREWCDWVEIVHAK